MGFSFDTIKDFDKHIGDSICHYDLLHKSIVNISSYFLRDKSQYIDLGCTTGSLIKKIKDTNPKIKAIGFDNESSNLQFKDSFEFYNEDLRHKSYILRNIADGNKIDLISSVFTLQFIEPSYRGNILKDVYKSLSVGGAFILCEKVYQKSGVFQEIFNFAHYDFKNENFSYEEILNKQKDLRKMMFPLTESENIEHLESVGFTKIEPFFKSLSFVGWLCIK